MTAIHNEPHPLAQKYVNPGNPQIAKKFGIVRVEDWDDRVAGETWVDRHARGGFPEADQYDEVSRRIHPDSWGDMYKVVRCHTQSTGELVLLHDDWVKSGQVIT